MQFIRPIVVTPAKLISSNVPETDNPAWSPTATYAIGNKVTLDRRNYEALAAIAAGVKPGAEIVDKDHPAKWLDVGAINRWKMFDEIVGTATANPESVSVTIKPGSAVNSLALFNVQGQSATITMTDPVDGLIYSRTVRLIEPVGSWYDYFFADVDSRTSFVILDMPTYGSAIITVTVTSGSIASIGALVIGKLAPVGVTTYGAKVGLDDYSRKERDKFGNLVVVEGAFSDTGDFPVIVDTDQVSKVRKMLIDVRAKPVVWIGEETYEATIIYGFFKSLDMIYSGPSVSDCQLSIEGLI
ncbi:hypothetical protein PS918_03142 [Pseudomonas fluorescens]|uniref:Carbohydrate-binding protein n=1 Tax=Pseudomonas fluorescens TaxID=294 RepID=A0A5E7ST46_PSEFL|nr:hypothetical protein [Pseudomonas fluorescens]VVP90021.1 hypothetical protein PS918_03142 [Pseudomonas fluorescens]